MKNDGIPYSAYRKFVQSFVKFQNMDPEKQIKDDGLQHIFIYATFV